MCNESVIYPVCGLTYSNSPYYPYKEVNTSTTYTNPCFACNDLAYSYEEGACKATRCLGHRHTTPSMCNKSAIYPVCG